MVEFKKGQYLTIEKVFQKNSKNYVQIGKKMVEAEVRGKVEAGEKLAVISVSHEKVILTPYSSLFKNRAFEDILKSFHILPSSDAYRLLQVFFSLEIPVSREKFEKAFSKIRNFKLPPKIFPLAVLRDKEMAAENMEKISAKSFDLQQMILFFLSLSSQKEVFLPIDPDGSFVYVQPKESQFDYACFMDFENLDLFYVKGWISKDGKKGEVSCFLMPFADFGFLKPILEVLKQRFPGMRFSQKYFPMDSIRSVDGFF